MEIDKWRRACEAGLRSIAETYHNLGIKTKPPLSKVVERGNPSEERMVSSPFALMTPGMTPAGMQAGATPLYTGTASPMGGMPALPPQTPHESCGFGNEQETIGVQEGLSTPALLAPASAHLTTGDNDIDADSHLLRLLEPHRPWVTPRLVWKNSFKLLFLVFFIKMFSSTGFFHLMDFGKKVSFFR